MMLDTSDETLQARLQAEQARVEEWRKNMDQMMAERRDWEQETLKALSTVVRTLGYINETLKRIADKI